MDATKGENLPREIELRPEEARVGIAVATPIENLAELTALIRPRCRRCTRRLRHNGKVTEGVVGFRAGLTGRENGNEAECDGNGQATNRGFSHGVENGLPRRVLRATSIRS
jgi:hypothetical protein